MIFIIIFLCVTRPIPRATLFTYTSLFRSRRRDLDVERHPLERTRAGRLNLRQRELFRPRRDRKSTRLNSSHLVISYAVFCLKKKKKHMHLKLKYLLLRIYMLYLISDMMIT